MIWLYRFLFFPALLISSPFYLLRMWRRGGYARHFRQRFGGGETPPPPAPGRRRIWLQAVSVGEVLAIGPIIEALAAEPSVELYLTTTTSTGYQLAVERYRERVLGIGYFPLDGWPFAWRAWQRLRPDLAIITEGERWPEHIHQAAQRRVPLICINARLSDRSYRRLRAGRAWVMPMMEGITRFLPASNHDEERFRELGVPPGKLRTTGNIKLDLRIPLLSAAERAAWRADLGLAGSARILLGSSTWPGEEAALLALLRAARAAGHDCRLLLVPRHAERRGEIAALLEESGFSFHLRSRGRAPALVDVAVGDTTGELRQFTQLADLVFVGKSLPPHQQGQTPVEAAALARPVVFGPGMSNFRVIAEELVANGAAVLVADAADLASVGLTLLQDEARRQSMASAGRAWQQANQGAVARTLAVVREELAALESRPN